MKFAIQLLVQVANIKFQQNLLNCPGDETCGRTRSIISALILSHCAKNEQWAVILCAI
jgi:hypothetical protein